MKPNATPPSAPAPKPAQQTAREQRQAKALRANLLRRKATARKA